MAEKTANYTPEMTKALIAAYQENPEKATIDAFAEKFGKSVKSVIAKLSREGVYHKPEAKTKTGQPVVKKDAVADSIGKVLGMTEAETSSLTKANKTALDKIFKAIANSKPI